MSGHRWIIFTFFASAMSVTGCQIDGGKTSLWNPFVRADNVNNIDEEPLPKFVRRISDNDKQESEQASPPIAESRVELLLADGQRALQENRIADAQKYYNEVIQFLPDNATAHHGLAMAADLTENWKEAEDHYRHALRSRPQDANLLCDIGYSYLLQNRYSEASSYLSQAITINPNHENAHTNLAMLDLRQGNHEAARQRIVARFGNTAKATQILAALESQVGVKSATTLAATAPEIPPNATFEEVREIARRERVAAEQRRSQQLLQTGMSTEVPQSNRIPPSDAGPVNENPAVHQTNPQTVQTPAANPARPWSILPPNATPIARPGSFGQPIDQSGQMFAGETLAGQPLSHSSAMNRNPNQGYSNDTGLVGTDPENQMPSPSAFSAGGANASLSAPTSPGIPEYNSPTSPTANYQTAEGIVPVRPSGAFQPPTQGISYGQPMGFGQPPVGTANFQDQNSGLPAGNANFGGASGSNQANWTNSPGQNPAQNISNLPLAGLNAGPGALFPIGQYPNSAGNSANEFSQGSMNMTNPNASAQYQNGQYQNGQYNGGQPPLTGAYNSVGPQSGTVNMGNVSAPGSNSVINGAMYGQPVSTLPSQEWMMQQQQQIQQMQQSNQSGRGSAYPGPNGSDGQSNQFGNTSSTTAPRPGLQTQPANPLASYENQLRQLDNQYNSTLQQMDRNPSASVPRAQY